MIWPNMSMPYLAVVAVSAAGGGSGGAPSPISMHSWSLSLLSLYVCVSNSRSHQCNQIDYISSARASAM